MTTPRLTTQAAIIGAGRLANMFVAAGSLVVLARVMPDKDSYGAVCQVIMLSVLLSQVFAMGLPQSIYYFLPRYAEAERRGFLLQTLVLLGGSGILLGIGLYAGADLCGRLLSSAKLPELLRAFAPYLAFTLPTLALEGTLLFYARPTTVVLFNVLARVGMFGALVGSLLLGASLPGAVTLWAGVAGGMCALALWLMLAATGVRPVHWHRRMLRESWLFALPLASVTLITISNRYFSRFYVSHAFGAAAFGIFNNATLEIPTVTMVANAGSTILLAECSRRVSAGEHRAMLAIWHSAVAKTAVLILASFGFLVFWGHETMAVLFSARFAECGPLFSLYVWHIPLILFSLQPLYVATGATRALLALSLIDLVAGVLGMIVLSHFFGLMGAVAGSLVVGYLGCIIWVDWFVRRVTPIGWGAFMPWLTIAKMIGIALAAGAASRLVPLWLAGAWPLLAVYLVALACFLALYAAGAHAAGLLEALLPERFRRPAPPPLPVAQPPLTGEER